VITSNIGNTLLQVYLDKECTVKVGFQISNEKTDKRLRAAIQGTVDKWFANGDVSEDEVIVAYIKLGHVRETETPTLAGFTRIDGTEVETSASAQSEAADTPY